MIRRSLAKPKSETGQLTLGRDENGRRICADGELPTTFNHPQASSILTRGGTEPTSAVSLFGHSSTPGDSMAYCSLPQQVYDVLPAIYEQSDMAANPRLSPDKQAPDAESLRAQPCCPSDAATLTSDNLHLSQVIGRATKQRQKVSDVQLIAQNEEYTELNSEIWEKVADLLRYSVASNTERA